MKRQVTKQGERAGGRTLETENEWKMNNTGD
jgi:hypothetical protein